MKEQCSKALSFEKAKLIEIDSKRVNGVLAAEGPDLYSRMLCRTVAVVELARRPAAQVWVKDAWFMHSGTLSATEAAKPGNRRKRNANRDQHAKLTRPVSE